jgi:aspartyl-tRNA(Asn)/glutamyl-tRNA(Gln) amidotransferase subunit C
MPDKKTVQKVAEVARLKLSESELEKFSKDLDSILEAFKSMQAADTRDAKPTFQPVGVKNVLRDDSVEKSLPQAEALKNARQREKGYFRGPRAV